jgi:hypothetical protein
MAYQIDEDLRNLLQRNTRFIKKWVNLFGFKRKLMNLGMDVDLFEFHGRATEG